MPIPLRPWVAAARGHIVEFNGRPIKSVKTIWRGVRLRAGFGLDVSPMTLRHTVASEMVRRSVPDFQRQCFMGHQASNTTDRNYVHVRPDFLRKAREAIESIVSEMGEAATSPIVSINQSVRANCVLARDDFRRTRLSRSRLLFYRSIFPKSGVHFSDLALAV